VKEEKDSFFFERCRRFPSFFFLFPFFENRGRASLHFTFFPLSERVIII